MSRVPYTPEQIKKLRRVEVKGVLVPIDSVTPKGKVEKLPKNILLKAIGQENPEKAFENKKIKGATKVEYNGIKFDSRLELTMYKLLQGAGVEFEFQKEYLLQERFRYDGETVRAVTLTVDFWLPGYNMIIDSKGYQTQQGALRWKILKWHLIQLNYKTESRPEYLPIIEMPRTEKECQLLINRILYDKK